jgi:hypothetical protein
MHPKRVCVVGFHVENVKLKNLSLGFKVKSRTHCWPCDLFAPLAILLVESSKRVDMSQFVNLHVAQEILKNLGAKEQALDWQNVL